MTVVLVEKITAYKRTDYIIGVPPRFVLRIGKHSTHLAQLFAHAKVQCAAYLTAENPRGAQQSDDLNAVAHATLLLQLRYITQISIEGRGRGAADLGNWPPERGVLAVGIDRHVAAEMGRHFRQDAVVWAGADAVPELLMLR